MRACISVSISLTHTAPHERPSRVDNGSLGKYHAAAGWRREVDAIYTRVRHHYRGRHYCIAMLFCPVVMEQGSGYWTTVFALVRHLLTLLSPFNLGPRPGPFPLLAHLHCSSHA